MKVFENLSFFDGREFVPGEIGVEGGVIRSVGQSVEGGERVDLEGAFVGPAYNDCHCHIPMLAESFTQVELGPDACPTLADVLLTLRRFAADNPDRPWLTGQSFAQGLVKENRYPTLAELDEVVPDRPVAIWHASRHGIVANSAALRAAGITDDTPDPEGGRIGRDEQGHADGLLFENACTLVRSQVPKMTKEELAEALLKSGRHLNRMGITAATDASSFRLGMEEELWAYERAAERGMRLRVRLTPLHELLRRAGGVPSRAEWDPWRDHPTLRIGGVKLFSDGAIGTRTAAITGRYADAQDGMLIYPQEELNERVDEIHQAGRQVIVHAIGDRAIDACLTAIEAAQARTPRSDCRHRIDHSMALAPELLQRYVSAGIAAAVQPEFILRFGDEYKRALGMRALKIKPVRSLLNAGISIGFSSDLTIVPGDPADGMLCAVERKTVSGEQLALSEAVTPAEALLLYTAGSAVVGFEEQEIGALRYGLRGDFVTFADNPLDVLASSSRPRVTATYFDGARLER